MRDFLLEYGGELLTIVFGVLMYIRTGTLVKVSKNNISSNVSVSSAEEELDSLIEYHKKALEKLETKKKEN